MTAEPPDDVTEHPTVGDRVTVTVPGADEPAPGRIVDDFGDQTDTAASTPRTWALARRWAIALDTGRLVFADTHDLAALTNE